MNENKKIENKIKLSSLLFKSKWWKTIWANWFRFQL